MSERTVKRFGRHSFSLPRSVGNALGRVISSDKAPEREVGSSTNQSRRVSVRHAKVSSTDRGEASHSSGRTSAEVTLMPHHTGSMRRSKTVTGTSMLTERQVSNMKTSPSTSSLLRSRPSTSASALPKYKPRHSSCLSTATTSPRSSRVGRKCDPSSDEKVGRCKRPTPISSPKSGTPTSRRRALKTVAGITIPKPPSSHNGELELSANPGHRETEFNEASLEISLMAAPCLSPTKPTRVSHHLLLNTTLTTLGGTTSSSKYRFSPSKDVDEITADSYLSSENWDASEEGDVSYLLGCVVSPTQSTPALPRTRRQKEYVPLSEDPRTSINGKESTLATHMEDDIDPFQTHDKGGVKGTDSTFVGLDVHFIELPSFEKQDISDSTALICDITAPFGSTPHDSNRLAASPMILNDLSKGMSHDIRSIDHLSPLSPSINLSRAGTPFAYASFTPEIKRTDEAIVTLLKLQLAATEKQLQDADSLHQRALGDMQSRIDRLEAQLEEATSKHNEGAEVLKGQVEALQNQLQDGYDMLLNSASSGLEKRLRCTPKPLDGAIAGWDSIREQGLQELQCIHEDRETLNTLLAGLNAIAKHCV